MRGVSRLPWRRALRQCSSALRTSQAYFPTHRDVCAEKPEQRSRHKRSPTCRTKADPNPLSAGFFKMGHQVFDDVGAPVRNGAGYMDFNTKDGQRFSVVHGYLLPALERRNLTILTGTRVQALSFEGNRCTGIRLQVGAAHREVIAERETILCAGVVESPRLLMLSGVGNADELRRYGIAIVSNLPGVCENLQDHCFLVGFVAETKAPIPGTRAGSQLFFRSMKEALVQTCTLCSARPH